MNETSSLLQSMSLKWYKIRVANNNYSVDATEKLTQSQKIIDALKRDVLETRARLENLAGLHFRRDNFRLVKLKINSIYTLLKYKNLLDFYGHYCVFEFEIMNFMDLTTNLVLI